MEQKDKIQEKTKEMLGMIANFMNLECQVEFREDKDEKGVLFVSVYTPENARFLIGKNGEVLKYLEYILRLYLSKNDQGEEIVPETLCIILDVNDYRKSRANYLTDLAREAVNRVRNTQKAEALLPMSSYERRIVHMELASYTDIFTESIGEEPYRRVVIKPFTSTI